MRRMYIENEIVYAVLFLWIVYGLHTLMKIRDERHRKEIEKQERYSVQGYYRKQFYPKENIHRTIYVEGHDRHFNPYIDNTKVNYFNEYEEGEED